MPAIYTPPDVDVSGGTVTTVSVASANGFAGSVATPSTTPAITLSTGVTGLVKGTGTALAAAGAADLPTTGLTITQHAGAITTDTDGATITFNLLTSDWHSVTLGGNRTLALSNPTTGQQFSIILKQDGTGTHGVTWFSGILWPGGTVPTLTTAANKSDVFTFKCIGTGVYLGFTAGQNL